MNLIVFLSHSQRLVLAGFHYLALTLALVVDAAQVQYAMDNHAVQFLFVCGTHLFAVAATYGKKVGDIAYIFCNDEKILEVNREYLQHDYYTDIITFDYCEDDTISGDLFISLDTVRTNSEMVGATYEQELHRVIIHGILHLCGINDKGEGEREIMEACENKALAMRG